MSEIVTIGRKKFEIYSFTGEVMSDKKWTSTHVSGGGGGGYSQDGTGHSSPVSISSTTTTHDQFFLRNKSGQEKSFEFSDMHLAMRVGQAVSVFWAIKRGKESGPYIAVYNHAADDLKLINSGIDSLKEKNVVGKIFGCLGGTIGIIIGGYALLSMFGFFLVAISGKHGAAGKYWNELGWSIWPSALVLAIYITSILNRKKVAKKYRTLFTAGIKSILANPNK